MKYHRIYNSTNIIIFSIYDKVLKYACMTMICNNTFNIKQFSVYWIQALDQKLRQKLKVSGNLNFLDTAAIWSADRPRLPGPLKSSLIPTDTSGSQW